MQRCVRRLDVACEYTGPLHNAALGTHTGQLHTDKQAINSLKALTNAL